MIITSITGQLKRGSKQLKHLLLHLSSPIRGMSFNNDDNTVTLTAFHHITKRKFFIDLTVYELNAIIKYAITKKQQHLLGVQIKENEQIDLELSK